MHQTKFKYENKQRAITHKISKRELWFLCTALCLDEIYHPQNFITIVTIGLEICSRQKSSKSYSSCAVHTPLMRSNTVANTVLDIFSRQKSSMKINKGQKLKN